MASKREEAQMWAKVMQEQRAKELDASDARQEAEKALRELVLQVPPDPQCSHAVNTSLTVHMKSRVEYCIRCFCQVKNDGYY